MGESSCLFNIVGKKLIKEIHLREKNSGGSAAKREKGRCRETQFPGGANLEN